MPKLLVADEDCLMAYRVNEAGDSVGIEFKLPAGIYDIVDQSQVGTSMRYVVEYNHERVVALIPDVSNEPLFG